MKNIRKFAAGVISCLLTFTFLKSSQFPDVNDSLSFYDKLNKGMPIRYVIIGDSIGRGSGAEKSSLKWYRQLERQWKKKYGSDASGKFIVQSGATSFEGLYKMDSQPIDSTVDAIFIVFGENDRKYMKAHDFSLLYESLIRRSLSIFPGAEIFTFTESCLSNPEFADVIEEISNHYNATNIDMRIPFQKSGLPISKVTTDLIHPNGLGYSLYADEIMNKLKKNIDDDKRPASLTVPLFQNTDMSFDVLADFTEQQGFELQNNYLVSSKKGSYVEFSFYGSVLGLKLLRSPDGGVVNVIIDGEYYTSLSTWWPFERERYLYISNGLSNDLHTVRFEVTGEKSERNISNESVIRLSSIILRKNIDETQ
ncbi:SGNH/GDSL hydrolase family protein [Peribacillus alkalitolerans]|uniref:SGNH/GDSL hydrolase family protein n=1 Tax=Peribacillus alkalitolerans TaxID=1550385 RepID=UPI0013D25CD7|nr:SGNH/GDSL hydrolase family protein [Peribacillus alkalitolerans]